MKRNRNYLETHAALLRAAATLAGQARGISISAVARVAGVDRATLYYHFANLDALLQEVRAAQPPTPDPAHLAEALRTIRARSPEWSGPHRIATAALAAWEPRA